MWWPIIQSLQSRLKRVPELDGIPIIAGSKPDLESYPQIEILRDKSDGSLFHGATHGTERIFLQGWTREDSDDPALGYEGQWQLELKIIDGIRKWAKEGDGFLGLAFKVKMVSNAGDGEAFRPVCGNRMVLDIEWKNAKSPQN
jgi:hypothetical protein